MLPYMGNRGVRLLYNYMYIMVHVHVLAWHEAMVLKCILSITPVVPHCSGLDMMLH